MKLAIKFLVILFIFSTIVSCNNDDSPDPNVIFEAPLNGTNSVPPNASTFTGTSTLIFNSTTKIFTIEVTHTIPADSLTNGHIHLAAVGQSGPPVFPFTSFTSPITLTSPALDAAQEADLNAGLYYVNIHTNQFPGGEIRGQLIRQ